MKILALIKNLSRKKNSLPLLLGLFSALVRLINIFGYPEFLGDEGIYASQGWWLVEYGQLSPYTYWYDHSPFGWLQIGFWQKLTGGPFAFGFSVNSGRIFMVLATAISTFLLTKIVINITKSKSLAVLPVLVFIFSPLAITYQRQLLLDNLAILYFLTGLYLLLTSKKRLLVFLISGLMTGLAFLSKETSLFLIPGLFILVYKKSSGPTRPFLISTWLLSLGFVALLFPLLAYLKLELLPASWLPGQRQHVSWIEGVVFQSGREGGNLLNPESDIRKAIIGWLEIDIILPILGLWTAFILLLNLKNPLSFPFLVMNLIFAWYLLRGGVVLGFYLVPQIVLWCLNIALVLKIMSNKFNYQAKTKKILLIGGAIVFLLILQNPKVYLANKNQAHINSLKFIRENVDTSAVIVTDPLFYTDLKVDPNQPGFGRTEWFSKVEKDPQIKEGKLEGQWQKIDYFLTTPGMMGEIEKNNYQFIKQAIEKSQVIKTFAQSGGSEANILYQIPETEKLSGFGKIVYLENKNENALEKIKKLIISAEPGFGGQLVLHSNQINPSNKIMVFADQEGGRVNRFQESPNISQNQVENQEEAFRLAKVRGIMLKRNGVGVNLAPVIDVGYLKNSYIAREERSFSDDPDRVTAFGKAMIDGYHQAGIKTIVKHFPGGLGRTSLDPHFGLPEINIDQGNLEKDLLPFQKLVGLADGVMVTHLAYPQIDPNLPTSLSPIFINALLRQKLDYQGPVIIDDLVMKAISQKYSQSQAIALGLKAGADLFIISQPEENLLKNLEQLIEAGEINPALISRALERAQNLIK
ncbi:MAG: glycoside hydrolase family 3 N-terminal domain-containing protein [Candidatus Shapirobacteria bacterium]|nr:glycoside hydrolase family 3 N-terminal domain-containing protein [Candidatus Shapirobacteria bacterium]